MEIIIILACIPLYILNSFCDKYVSATSKVLMLYGYEKNSVAYMTLCHSSGLLLPCILGHFLWNETLTLPALFGILLVIFSILLLKDTGSKKQTSGVGILIGLIILIASGGVMVLQKIVGLYFHGTGAEAFNFYGFLCATLLLSCLNGTGKRQIADKKKICLYAAGSAISLCVISIVMTRMTSTIPSVIMFPLFNGLGVILVTLLSAKIFKEKLTAKSGIGVVLGLVGLFMTNL